MKCLQVNGMTSGVCFQILHQIQTKKNVGWEADETKLQADVDF